MIFDCYRQTFQHENNHERGWNSKRGWFKLAHVCQEWRLIVLASPSHLRLRLLFTEHRARRVIAIATAHLPHLLIIVDFSDGVWTVEAQNRMVSALAYPDRVCGIAFRGRSGSFRKLLEAMNVPFPALERLELDFTDPRGSDLERLSPTLKYPPPFLWDNTLSLRHLTYIGRADLLLFKILSHTKSLVEINMCVDEVRFLRQRSAFLACLQNIPCLRCLRVEMFSRPVSDPSPHEEGRDVVVLSKLTSLRIIGLSTPVDTIIAELAAPSLQEFHVSLNLRSSTLSIPYLSKFIRDAGTRFLAAQLKLLKGGLTISMLTHAHFIDDPPFNITASGSYSIAQIGVELSAMASTVEDISFTSPVTSPTTGSILGDLASWREFFMHFCNIKILRVHHGLGMEVVDMLRHDDGQPIIDPLPAPEGVDLDATMPSITPNDSNQYALGVLPTLEEIVVYMGNPGTPTRQSSVCPSELDLFEPVVAARKQMGCPVEVYWNTDRALPE